MPDDSPTLLSEVEPDPPFATVVATDGTLIRLHRTRFDEIVLRVGGREAKTLDRFQVAALRCAMLATAEVR